MEDDLRGLQLVHSVLRQNGYTVLQAENGVEALQLLEHLGEPVDLLVTDVVMPKMSGRELADEALRILPELRVIYTSGYAGSVFFRRDSLKPDAIFLPKPFTPEALTRKVREVLDQPTV